eukprot:CFRG4312T1
MMRFQMSSLLLSVATLLLSEKFISAANGMASKITLNDTSINIESNITVNDTSINMESNITVNDTDIRINELQYLGTHNSYHVVPSESILTLIRGFESAFGKFGSVDEWEYTHNTLDYQLTHQNVRHFALDVYYDPEGGLYANPKVLTLVNETREPEIVSLLMKPGYKVLHISEVDFRSTCYTFIDCLEQINNWSRNNTGHMPLMVCIELKETATPDPLQLGFVNPPKANLAELEMEILSVFDREQLITPNVLLKNNATTINQGLILNGWPTLADSRGKVMFTIQGKDIKSGKRYPAGVDGPLSDRVFFPESEPNTDNGAFVLLSNPNDTVQISSLVNQTYLVRTRADAGTREARAGSTERRDLALASGSQFVTTDYPYPQKSPPNIGFNTSYSVSLPTRCNPMNGPKECDPVYISQEPISQSEK